MAEIGWHHSIARPWKLHIGRKHRRDISYTSRVIANFVPNFVTMATGVGRCNIWLTPVDSQTPKIPYQTQTSKRYLLYKPSYSQFCCHGTLLQCFDTVGWVIRPVKTVSRIAYCVGGDVKHCSLTDATFSMTKISTLHFQLQQDDKHIQLFESASRTRIFDIQLLITQKLFNIPNFAG